MLRSYVSWLIPGIFALVGFGSSIESAKAQTTYSFDATYDASSTLLNPITEEITSQTVSGVSNNAPFGLTKASGVLYIKSDLSNNSYNFSSNPETFGLQGLPQGGVTLFGEGNNKLFYEVENGTGAIDLINLTTTGTNTNIITGGEGLFQGATGTLTGSEVYQIDNLLVDPTSSSTGTVRITGTIEVPLTRKVPESNNAAALIGAGIIGAILLHRRCKTAVDLKSFT
ncbi:MAG: hypothetical protein VKN72_19715 [Nostocales cyanobacterium 94392]|nr:hypothetical protein [Nostocales cyanobacterium 94392]